jgi:hypothetical protein
MRFKVAAAIGLAHELGHRCLRFGAVTGPHQEREILERSIYAIAENARDACALIDEIHAAGFPADGPTMVGAKRLRMELLQTKGEQERELARLVLD